MSSPARLPDDYRRYPRSAPLPLTMCAISKSDGNGRSWSCRTLKGALASKTDREITLSNEDIIAVATCAPDGCCAAAPGTLAWTRRSDLVLDDIGHSCGRWFAGGFVNSCIVRALGAAG